MFDEGDSRLERRIEGDEGWFGGRVDWKQGTIPLISAVVESTPALVLSLRKSSPGVLIKAGKRAAQRGKGRANHTVRKEGSTRRK